MRGVSGKEESDWSSLTIPAPIPPTHYHHRDCRPAEGLNPREGKIPREGKKVCAQAFQFRSRAPPAVPPGDLPCIRTSSVAEVPKPQLALAWRALRFPTAEGPS